LIQTRSKPTLGEKLGLQAAQMADAIVPAVMGKIAESLSKASSSLVQMRDPKL
jgi:serine protease SohB